MAAIGLVFGSSQTGVAARLDGLGRDELTGAVYAMMGVGSAVAGLLTTRLPRSFGLAARIAAGGAGLVAAGLLLSWASAPLALAGACLVAGIALAPSLISSYALAERAAPQGWGTTMMTALSHRERGRRGRRRRGRGPAGRPGLPRRRPARGLRSGGAGARRRGRRLADAAPRRLIGVPRARRHRADWTAVDTDARLEQTIVDLLASRADGRDDLPVRCRTGPWARRTGATLMEPATAGRPSAGRPRHQVVVTQGGEVVDPATAQGPIRIRRA